MLADAATLLLHGLNRHLHAQDGNPLNSAEVAIAGNPAELNAPAGAAGLENQVLLTLVNVEEEATLKNGPTSFVEGPRVAVRNRPVHLNLLLLISANYDEYTTALQRLSQVVAYFQSQKKFEPAAFPGALPNWPAGTELSLTLELVTLTLEEVNHVWGALGGHALPFATYRARLAMIEHRVQAGGGGLVQDTRIDLRDTVGAG